MRAGFRDSEVSTFRTIALVAFAVTLLALGLDGAQQTKTTDHKNQQEKQVIAPKYGENKSSEPNPMDVMAWFSGDWRANIKAQNGNPPLQVDAHMKWAENRRAMSFEVWFTQPGAKPAKHAEYYGLYFWDPQKKTLRMIQVNSKGDLSTADMQADGNTFRQRTHVERVDGTTQEQQSVINLAQDKNSFHWKVQVQKDSQWVDAVELDYHRVDAKKASGGVQ